MTKDFAYVIEVRNLKIGWVAFINHVDQISHVRQELLQLSPLKQEEASKMEQKWTSGRFPLWEGFDPPLLEEGQVLTEKHEKEYRKHGEAKASPWLAFSRKVPSSTVKKNEFYQWLDLSKSLLIRAQPSNTLILNSWNSEQRNKYNQVTILWPTKL